MEGGLNETVGRQGRLESTCLLVLCPWRGRRSNDSYPSHAHQLLGISPPPSQTSISLVTLLVLAPLDILHPLLWPLVDEISVGPLVLEKE